jgi:hypothetical protein
MTSVANSLGIRSNGIAAATLATLDLARARIFYLGRLGLPPLVDEAEKFALAREPALSRCASRQAMKGSTLARLSIEGIALWSQSDEVQRIGSALAAAGVEHTSARSPSGVASVSSRKKH